MSKRPLTNRSILIVTHSFPPLNKIGSLRVFSFAKYLSQMGNRVTVLTTKKYSFDGDLDLLLNEEGVDLIEIPYLPSFFSVAKNKNKAGAFSSGLVSQAKRVLRVIRQNLIGNLWDIRDGWVKKSLSTAVKVVEERKIDIVISSYGPPAPHALASKLKKKYPSLFWVADYRDLWSQNNVEVPRFPFSLIQSLKEQRIISGANLITTVSEQLSSSLMSKFKKPTLVIENGFLPEDEVGTVPGAGKKITLTYTGQIYKKNRDPSPLFQAMAELFKEKVLSPIDIQVNFFGYNVHELSDQVRSAELGKSISLNPQIDRETALKAQRESTALLFLEAGSPEARGVVTGKLFEYLVSGKPILALGITDESAAAKIILKTKTGEICGNDVEKIKAFIQKLVNGQYKYSPDLDEIRQYRRDKLVAKLANKLNSLLRDRG